MNETIKRRLSPKNVKSWGLPDLVLIDGGKGQLESAIEARNEMNQEKLVFIGLAKREEQIVISKKASNVTIDGEDLKKLRGYAEESNDFMVLNLPDSAHLVRLLQRIRDESHRFAVSYHSSLKRSRQTKSIVEEIPGIGPATKKTLIRKFGSLRAVTNASLEELETVIGKSKAKKVFDWVVEAKSKKS